MGLGAADIELGQVQRRTVEPQQAGLLALVGEEHFGFFRQRQLRMAALPGLALADHATVAVEQFQADIVQRLAAFQGLSEHVQAVLVAVHREPDVAEGEQGRRLRVVVSARGAHYCQVHARLLQGLEAGDRQQQGFAGVARRVQVKAAAIDQLGHGQQFTGFIALQAVVAPPLGKERRQRFGFDPEEFDVDLVDIQGNHRQAFGQARGQQTATAGKPDSRLQVAGFQAADVFASQLGVIDRQQSGIHRQHQLALRLKVTQAQFHQVVGELPGAIDLAAFAVDQVQLVSEFLLGVQGHREAHRQGAGTVELDFRDIHHAQLSAGVTLLQRREVLPGVRLGGADRGRRCGTGRGLARGR